MSCGMAAIAVSYFSARAGGRFRRKRLVFRRGHAQQAGIQLLQVVHRGIDALGHQPQVDGIIDGHLVGILRRGSGVTRSKPILRRDSWP